MAVCSCPALLHLRLVMTHVEAVLHGSSKHYLEHWAGQELGVAGLDCQGTLGGCSLVEDHDSRPALKCLVEAAVWRTAGRADATMEAYWYYSLLRMVLESAATLAPLQDPVAELDSLESARSRDILAGGPRAGQQ